MSLARDLPYTRTWSVSDRAHAHEVLRELAHVAKREEKVGTVIAVDVSMTEECQWYGVITLDGYPPREQS